MLKIDLFQGTKPVHLFKNSTGRLSIIRYTIRYTFTKTTYIFLKKSC